MAAVAVVAVAFAAGCGGGGAGGGAARQGARGLDDLARELRGARQPGAIQGVLSEIRNRQAVDAAIASAFCQGVTSIANTGQLPTGGDWFSFLRGQVEASVFGVSSDIVEDKIEEFDAAMRLSEINPPLAARYARGCLFRL